MNDLTQSWHDHQRPMPTWEQMVEDYTAPLIAQIKNASAFDRMMADLNRDYQRRVSTQVIADPLI